MKATLLKKIEGWVGDARLYRLEPPLEGAEYVIVSAVVAVYSGPETYIFPATDNGDVRDYGELTGSYRGGLSHNEALRGAGYEVA